MPSRVSWLRWGELGLGGLLGLELLEGVECLVESESGWGVRAFTTHWGRGKRERTVELTFVRLTSYKDLILKWF